MKKIYKLGPIPVDYQSRLVLPDNVTKLLHVGVQEQNDGSEQVFVWYECNQNHPSMKGSVYYVGTGWDIKLKDQYIGTAQTKYGLVWHVFYSEEV